MKKKNNKEVVKKERRTEKKRRKKEKKKLRYGLKLNIKSGLARHVLKIIYFAFSRYSSLGRLSIRTALRWRQSITT